jgi:hypothetical protein
MARQDQALVAAPAHADAEKLQAVDEGLDAVGTGRIELNAEES